MKKTFLIYFSFLFYLECVFHLFCFKGMTFLNFFLLFLLSLVFSSFLTFLSSLVKKEKINSLFVKIFCFLIAFIFCAEFVYFKIYDSFFSFNGLFFIGAVKDGFGKVLTTILQNSFAILLFLLPVIFIFIKIPKKIAFLNKLDCCLIFFFLLLGISYSTFSIFYINRETNFSLYNLLFQVNLPIQNVKNFGLVASSTISLERKLFGFHSNIQESENIYTNERTSLAGDLNLKYNMDSTIQFDSLIENETNPTIQKLHSYFKSQVPTIQNKFTGLFENKNLIFIMAESLDEIAIDPLLTPTLYHLKQDGIIFNNYFSPKYPASTADGEYMLEWATLPIIGEDYSLVDMVYNTNPYLLPRSLKAKGYKTFAYHNYFGYYNLRSSYFKTLNFDGVKYCHEGIETRCERFHGSDLDMMDQTIEDYLNEDRFFAYYITLSGHGSYDDSNFIATKHLSKLADYNYPAALKYYLAANIDLDLALEKLLIKLTSVGKLDDTVIIISSDHTPYFLTPQQLNYRSSMDRNNKFDSNRGTLLIFNNALKEHVVVDKYAMNIDVLPTILNLFNIPYDSRILIGKDIFASNTEGLVILPDLSWINNNGRYDASTGSFQASNPNVDQKYIESITQQVNDKFNISSTMQYNNYYQYLFH